MSDAPGDDNRRIARPANVDDLKRLLGSRAGLKDQLDRVVLERALQALKGAQARVKDAPA